MGLWFKYYHKKSKKKSKKQWIVIKLDSLIIYYIYVPIYNHHIYQSSLKDSIVDRYEFYLSVDLRGPSSINDLNIENIDLSYLVYSRILLTEESLIKSLKTILFKYFLMLLFRTLLSIKTSAEHFCLLRIYLMKKNTIRNICSITNIIPTNST